MNAVSALVLRDDGRILLVRRAKPPLLGALTLPGGRIDPNELPSTAVAREVLEETSLKVAAIAHVTTVEVPASPSTPPYSIGVFTTDLLSSPESARPCSDAAALVWASPGDLTALGVPPATCTAIAAALRTLGPVLDDKP